MSSAQERAADIVHDAMDGEGWNAMTIADALHAANLLVDDDTARLVELGRAVEEADAHVAEFLAGVTDEDRERLQADIRQQARHLALGRAVEQMERQPEVDEFGMEAAINDAWNACLDAIYREAGVEQ